MLDLTPAQAAPRIATLLATPESRTLDFKRISAKHGRMIETVCAFANSEGGLLIIGVGDAKDLKPGAKPQSRLFGIEENPEAFDDFRRQLMQRFLPPVERLHWLRLPCTLHDGSPGHIVMLRVEKSDHVHSVLGDGTWTRMDASNRQLNAAEITELAYRRGVRSAASETVPVALDLLETDTWRGFVAARGLKSGGFADQLLRIGLAAKVGMEVAHPRCGAAVRRGAGQPAGGLRHPRRHPRHGVRRQGCRARCHPQPAQDAEDGARSADRADRHGRQAGAG
jgi:ATP-dependent DNA helicase RecG